MYSCLQNFMNKAILSSILQDENILLETKPDFARNLITVPVGLLIIVFALLLLNISGGTCTINGVEKIGDECTDVLHNIGYIMIAIGILAQVPQWLYPLVTEYVITSKRVIIKSGFIGADVRSIYYHQMRSVFVNVGLIDKIFGTGTVGIDTGDSSMQRQSTLYTNLKSIKVPYEVSNTIHTQLGNK